MPPLNFLFLGISLRKMGLFASLWSLLLPLTFDLSQAHWWHILADFLCFGLVKLYVLSIMTKKAKSSFILKQGFNFLKECCAIFCIKCNTEQVCWKSAVLLWRSSAVLECKTKPDSTLIFKNISKLICWFAWLGFLVDILLLLC